MAATTNTFARPGRDLNRGNAWILALGYAGKVT